MNKFFQLVLIAIFPVLIFGEQNLTLEKCRQLALKNNRQIKMANENIAASHHNVKSSFTAFLPKLNLVGNYTRLNNKIKYQTPELSIPVGNRDGSFAPEHLKIVKGDDGLPLTKPDGTPIMVPKNWIHMGSQTLNLGEHNNYILNIGLIQPLFTGGKILQQYKISKSTEKIAKAKKVLTRSEVILKTDELFWKILSIKEKVKLAQDYQKLVKTHIRDLEEYLREGLITENDLLKAKVKLNEAKMNLLKAQNGLALAKMALCQHMGLPLSEKITLQNREKTDYITLNSPEREDDFLNKRSELQILKESVKINESLEKIAISQYLPNILLTSNYTTLNPNPYNSFKEEFGSDFNVGISCEIQLFNWNQRWHKVSAARHLKNSAQQKYEESKDLIKLEVRQAAFRVNESIKKINLATVTMLQAEENLKVTEDNFKEGIAKSSDVLEAQTLWQKAKSEVIDSKSEYKINQAIYNKTIGKYNLQ